MHACTVCASIDVGVTARLVPPLVADYDEETPVPQRDASLHQRPNAAVNFLPHALLADANSRQQPRCSSLCSRLHHLTCNVLSTGWVSSPNIRKGAHDRKVRLHTVWLIS